MGDPLSITASIIAVLQATSVAVGYFQGVRHAAKDIKNFIGEFESLKNILTSLCDYASVNPDSTTLQKFDTDLQKCLSDITELHAKLAKGFSRRGMSLRWPLKDKECWEYLDKIERLKSSILLAMSIDRGSQSKAIAIRIGGGVEGEIRMKVLIWLNPAAFDERHLEISIRRQNNTGEWLLKEKVVVDWVEVNSILRLLWGYGIPGAGKTFLSSLMIDDLRGRATAENWGVAFMYFNHSEQNQQTSIFFLSSVVKQLACQILDLLPELSELYGQLHPKQMRPTFEQLYLLLLAVTKPFTQVFIICDALDECEYAQRTKLLPLFDRMGKDGIKLFLTSREHPEDIQRSLQSAAKIKLSAQDEDIRVYIERKIAESPQAERLVTQAKCKEEIISELQTCANGMYGTWADSCDLADIIRFLLVHFHIRYLCEQTTSRQLLDALKTLKDSSSGESPMDPTYKRAMETVQSQSKSRVNLALNVFAWLVKSQRVLTIRELQQAVSVEQHQTMFDVLALPSKKTMIDVCASLVTIDQERNTVRLAHFTIKEYLVNKATILRPKDAEFRVVMACATFLSYEDFSSELPYEDFSESFSELMETRYNIYPFLRYACTYFRYHLQQCDEALSLDLVLGFLRKRQNLLFYINMVEHERNIFAMFCWGEEQDGPLLNLAAFLGHVSAIRSLLNQSADVSDQGTEGRIAVNITAMYWYNSNIEISLKSRNPWGIHRSLGYATLYRHVSEIRLLIERWIGVSGTDHTGKTLLHAAASRGDEEVVKTLIERGADLSAKDDEGRTPLHLAASCYLGGGVVGILIEEGADVSAKDDKGRTPLHHALLNGRQAVAKALIGKGADVSATDNKRQAPLHLVSSQGVVRALIAKGADVSVRDNEGRTPLHLVSSQEVVKTLIAKGADVSAKDDEERTPLHLVTSQAIARTLIAKGADVSAKDDEGRTPLHLAASRYLGGGVVGILIEEGADVSAKDGEGRTPLHLAALNNRQAAAKTLIKKRADVSAKDDEGRTPLHLAALNSRQAVVKTLIEKGADISARDDEGRTPLHLAALNSRQAVVKALIKKGADVSTTDNKGQAPLHLATSCYFDEKVVGILIEKDADVSATGGGGLIPPHIAVFRGKEVIVKVLLANGADISAMDNEGKTPMQKTNNPSFAKLLPEYQVRVRNGAESSVLGMSHLLHFKMSDPLVVMKAARCHSGIGNGHMMFPCYYLPSVSSNPESVRKLLHESNTGAG